jgi:hypothetical protein
MHNRAAAFAAFVVIFCLFAVPLHADDRIYRGSERQLSVEPPRHEDAEVTISATTHLSGLGANARLPWNRCRDPPVCTRNTTFCRSPYLRSVTPPPRFAARGSKMVNPGTATKVFISYRRADTAGHAGRLYDRLCGHFGPANVFMDVEDIAGGVDFVEAIQTSVGNCDVLIAIIGRGWIEAATRATSSSRASDWVALEITTALARNVRVIPVLVQGVHMPGAEQWPERLAPLARLNAIELSDMRWRTDVDRLVRAIRQAAEKNEPAAVETAVSRTEGHPSRQPSTIKLASLAAVIVAVATLTVFAEPIREKMERSPGLSLLLTGGPPIAAESSNSGAASTPGSGVPQSETASMRARVLAVDLALRAQSGEDFAALAREYSQDSGSAQRGGDLGYFRRGVMVPSFEEAAFHLQPGQISAIVESPFGYHIIKVEDRRGAPPSEEVRARHILIRLDVAQPNPEPERRSRIGNIKG